MRLSNRYWLSVTLALCAASAAVAPIPAFTQNPSASTTSAPSNDALVFEVVFDSKVSKQAYTGRVWVMTGPATGPEPRYGPNWFSPSPFFAVDVREWKPDTPLRFDDNALAFPEPPSRIKASDIRVQAVMALNVDARLHGKGEGNAYSAPVRIEADRAAGPVRLRISRVVRKRKAQRSERIKPFEVPSQLLAKFHGRPMTITGAVILPEEYDERANDRFPTLYTFPGFGQTRETAAFYLQPTREGDPPLVRVLLDADCALGVHEFADSANNGPCGQALVEEVIPWLERHFRLMPESSARFLTGHSSGGWASLWQQITYPDYFGGTWSSSPDPVDFREFTNVNIYENDGNAFRTAAGILRPIARRAGRVAITFKQFSDMDNVVGRGEQLGSFEAVFSPRGPDGQPMRLWNRKTGRIDPSVAKAWEKYDIRLVLERGWAELGPKLRGKLHVYVGDSDTFYLNQSVALLKSALAKLGSDADIRILPDEDHFSIMFTKELAGIPHAAAQRFAKSHPQSYRKPADSQP